MQSRIPKPISSSRIIKEKNEIEPSDVDKNLAKIRSMESTAPYAEDALDESYDISIASTDAGYEKILKNIEKLSNNLKNLEMNQDELMRAKSIPADDETNQSDLLSTKSLPFLQKNALDSLPEQHILPNTQIMQELEDRAKRLQKEIAHSLGESESFPDIPFMLNRSEYMDDGLPSLPDTDDLELIGLLNSKIGLDLLMLDESFSSLDSDENESESSVTVEMNRKESPKVTSVPIKELSPKAKIESPNGYTGFMIKFNSLELTEQVEKPSSLWIEYNTTNSEEDPVRFKVNIPPKWSKPVFRVPFARSHRLPEWNTDPKLTVRMFALGKKRDSKYKKDMVELWSAQGFLKQADLLYSDKYKLSTQVILCKDASSSQAKFNPASVYGQLSLEMELTKPAPIEPQVETPPVKQPPPVYLNVSLSTIRGLKPSSTPLLLNLRFKVTRQDVYIETVPISYHDEFDVNTGELVPPLSFNYTLTRPFQYSDIQSLPSPMIIEVYRHSSASLETNVKYKNLLGLLRLPISSLVKAWDGEGMVEIPESDYAIVDPISGDCVGWVSSYMNLQDTLKPKLVENVEVPQAIPEPVEEIPHHVELQPVQETHIIEEQREPETFTETTTLHVQIHRSCGLLQLLESQEDSDHIAIALEKGPNIFITLNLFPEGETDVSDLIITPVVAYSFTPTFDYSIQITVSCHDSDLLKWIKKGAFSIGKLYHRIPRHLVVNGVDSIYLGEFRLALDSLINSPNGIDHEWFLIQGGGAVQLSLCFDNGLSTFSQSVPQQSTVLATSHSISTWIDYFLDFHIEGIVQEGNIPTGEIIVEYKLPNQLDSSRISKVDKTMGLKASLELIVDPFKTTCLPLSFYRRSEKESHEYLGTAFVNLDKQVQQAKVLLRTTSKVNDGNDPFPAVKKTLSLIQVDCPDWIDVAVQISLKVSAKRKRRNQVMVKPTDESTYLSESFIDNISKIEQIGEELDHHEEEMLQPPLVMPPLEEMVNVIEPPTTIPFLETPSIVSEPIPDLMNTSKAIIETQDTPPDLLTIPFYISIEKAMNLPLVSDPLGTSFPSPFVKSSDSFTSTLPNSFVTLTPSPKFFKVQSLVATGKPSCSITSSIIFNQTNPIWNFQSYISLLLKKGFSQQLKDLKKPSNSFRFKVWHTPREPDELFFPDDSLEDNECLGICTVPLDPLLTGMTEIHGWYPIQDHDGVSRGQLMVRISPTEDLSRILKEWSDKEEFGLHNGQDPSYRNHSVLSNNPPQHTSHKPIFLLKENPHGKDNASIELEKKPQETFVWNGKQWQHQSIDKKIESPQQNIDELDKSKDLKLSSSIFQKSISETMNDLEKLRTSMMSKLQKLNESGGDGPLVSLAEKHDVGTDAVMEAMTLPIIADFKSDQEQLTEHPSNPFQDETMNESKIVYELNRFDDERNNNIDELSLSLLDTSNPAISRTNDLMEKIEYLEQQDPSFLSDSLLAGVNERHGPTRQELKEMLQMVSHSREYPTIEHQKVEHSIREHSKGEHSIVEHSIVEHSMVEHSMVEHSMVEHSMVEHPITTEEHSMVEHSIVEHPIIGNSIVEQGKPPLAPGFSSIAPIPTSSMARRWKELDKEAFEIKKAQIEEASRKSEALKTEEASLNLMQRKLGNISLESSTRIANVLRKSTSKEI